jgi:hypothetical protein
VPVPDSSPDHLRSRRAHERLDQLNLLIEGAEAHGDPRQLVAGSAAAPSRLAVQREHRPGASPRVLPRQRHNAQQTESALQKRASD